jgi:hypothetical protein
MRILIPFITVILLLIFAAAPEVIFSTTLVANKTGETLTITLERSILLLAAIGLNLWVLCYRFVEMRRAIPIGKEQIDG